MDVEAEKGQEQATYPESEGYIADDETRPGTTAVDNHAHGGFRLHISGEGAEKPAASEKIKEKLWEVENHLKGKEVSVVEDPHPELAYTTSLPQDKKPGLVSRKGHKLADTTSHVMLDQGVEPVPANKGVGSSELGTGYEEDGEETVNSAADSKYDGVKASSAVDSEEGSEGSFSHPIHLSDFSTKEAQEQAASGNETVDEDETIQKPGFFGRVVGGKKRDL